MTLFEEFLLWLNRNQKPFSVSTGIAFGHQICKTEGCTIVELGREKVSLEKNYKDSGSGYNNTAIFNITNLTELINKFNN